MRTVVIAVNNSDFFWSHRLYMAEQAKLRGYRIVVLAPNISESEFERYRRSGFEFRPIHLSRHGINPFSDLKTIRSFRKAMRDLHIDVFHSFTVKCNIYGTFVANEMKVPAILATVTGIGVPFTKSDRKSRFIQWAIRYLYQKYVPSRATLIFQNETDLRFFKEQGFMKEGQRTALIPGNGVDLDRYKPVEKSNNQVPRILFPARIVFEKGIRETIEACEKLHEQGEKFELWVCGTNEDKITGAVPNELREKWKTLPFVKWLGFQDAMHKIYGQVDIVCLPSYREGLSQSLIEASACGLPMLTTDVPGCRDVVLDGETGCLVQAESANEIIEPLRSLIRSQDLRLQLGARAREVATERYDRKKIVALFLNLYVSAFELTGRLGNSRLFNQRAS